jgi:hypothetical protein
MSINWAKIRDGNILLIHHSTSSIIEIRVYEEDSDKYNEIYIDYWELESLKRGLTKTDTEEKLFNQTDMDLFAVSFSAWYSYSEEAQIYKSQKLSASEMLKIYKDRPYLKTDSPQQN